MRLLRSSFTSRLVAALLAFSLLPAVLAPLPARAATGAYGEWLRAELGTPADAALADEIESALEAAHAEHPATLDAFIAAFVDAFAAAHDVDALAGLLDVDADAALAADADLTTAAVVRSLQSRYARLGGEGIVPDLLSNKTRAPLATHGARGIAAAPVSALRLQAAPAPPTAPADVAAPVPFRLQSAARPLGP